MMETEQILNPEQQRAAEHVEGPLLVIAGAGSGKTRIITCRIAQLLERGVPPEAILAVTFTNKAASEMGERVRALTGASVLTSTFHSLSARILREAIDALGYRRDFVIYDEEDKEKALRECFTDLGLKPDKAEMKRARYEISQCKNSLLEPAPSQHVYQRYQQKLKEYNALDFDDLLFLTVKLLRDYPEVAALFQERWAFILIDEYQDTNAAQYTIVRLLALKHNNVFAVGDPDQSIYSWRGANVGNILNFAHDFPGAEVVSLEQNYRSRDQILQAANALIQHNESRYEKDLWSQRGGGAKVGLFIAHDEREETRFVLGRLLHHIEREGILLKECAIFYRTNFQSRLYEDALLREGIPYQIVGAISYYQRREVKDVLAFLRVALGGSDFLSFARTINLPRRGFGEKSLAGLRLFAEEQNLEIFAAAEAALVGGFKLTAKQREGLSAYVELIQSLRALLLRNEPLSALIVHAIECTGYLDYLREDPESFEERRANLQELVAKASSWSDEQDAPTLSAFLMELSLKSGGDGHQERVEGVRLMTLHNAKGLEFALVFIVGLEEDLLPHISAKGEGNLEEERRLCYVGMTRAKEFLYLTASRYRFIFGDARYMRPSRFLMEIPLRLMHNYQEEAQDC